MSSSQIKQIPFPAFVEDFGAVTNIPEDSRQHWCLGQAGSQLISGVAEEPLCPWSWAGCSLSVSIVPCWSRARHSLGWDPHHTSSSRPLPRSVPFEHQIVLNWLPKQRQALGCATDTSPAIPSASTFGLQLDLEHPRETSLLDGDERIWTS